MPAFFSFKVTYPSRRSRLETTLPNPTGGGKYLSTDASPALAAGVVLIRF